MSPRLALLALALVLAGCTDRTGPEPPGRAASPPTPGVRQGGAPAARDARERLARRLARALANAEFRHQVKAALDRSPVREHKLHVQRWLDAGDRGSLRAVARANGISEAALAADAHDAAALEMYLPVPAHRAAWRGDGNLLVATVGADHEAPVAFTLDGRRLVLDAEHPPATPVLVVVPVETDFDHPQAGPPVENFLGGGGGAPAGPPHGLYMKRAHFVSDFEGWPKGNPEFEIHILGQAGSSDSLQTYSCAGEQASSSYSRFNMDEDDWTGSVVLLSDLQITAYRANHPGQSFRVFAVEDDDTPCQIKADPNRFSTLIKAVEAAYPRLTGGRDTTTSSLARLWKRANALQKILRALGGLIATNDELIGNAVEASVTGVSYPNANWVVKGENNKTNGWLFLQMQ
jgi:hypothetical protein